MSEEIMVLYREICKVEEATRNSVNMINKGSKKAGRFALLGLLASATCGYYIWKQNEKIKELELEIRGKWD